VTHQATLPDMPPSERPVNVSSVPQRSPFRYPGGKTWLIPRVRTWLSSQATRPKLLIEPFCGGGIVSLTAAAEDLAEHVVMVEMDPQVAAVWHTITGGDAKWLADRILGFDLNVDSVKGELDQVPGDTRAMAFQTILKNRTYHGGILAAGSGLLKHGEAGKGISSRWYPETLARRIMAIDAYRHRITFIEGDGLAIVEQHLADESVAYFVDPPYTAAGKKAGKRLYTYSELDHERLFELCSRTVGNSLLTYDNAEGVVELATRYAFKTRRVAMQNTHLAKMNELLISRDLSWMEAE
jgi:DNA adenine methylase